MLSRGHVRAFLVGEVSKSTPAAHRKWYFSGSLHGVDCLELTSSVLLFLTGLCPFILIVQYASSYLTLPVSLLATSRSGVGRLCSSKCSSTGVSQLNMSLSTSRIASFLLSIVLSRSKRFFPMCATLSL